MAPEIRQDRQEARNRVMYDLRISVQARLVYYYLDDAAGSKGIAWPKRNRIAAICGISIREVAYCLRELEQAGYIATEAQRYRREYTLFWKSPGVHSRAPLEDSTTLIQGCTAVQVRGAQPCTSGAAAPIYEPNQRTCSSTREDLESRSVFSTSAPDRPTDPPEPPHEEPTTPEDQLLIGLANRNLAADCRMAAQLIGLLEIVPVEFFLDSLDVKLRRKYRLRQDFDLAWLPQAARDACSQWRSARMAHEWRRSRAVAAAV